MLTATGCCRSCFISSVSVKSPLAESREMSNASDGGWFARWLEAVGAPWHRIADDIWVPSTTEFYALRCCGEYGTCTLHAMPLPRRMSHPLAWHVHTGLGSILHDKIISTEYLSLSAGVPHTSDACGECITRRSPKMEVEYKVKKSTTWTWIRPFEHVCDTTFFFTRQRGNITTLDAPLSSLFTCTLNLIQRRHSLTHQKFQGMGLCFRIRVMVCDRKRLVTGYSFLKFQEKRFVSAYIGLLGLLDVELVGGGRGMWIVGLLKQWPLYFQHLKSNFCVVVATVNSTKTWITLKIPLIWSRIAVQVRPHGGWAVSTTSLSALPQCDQVVIC